MPSPKKNEKKPVVTTAPAHRPAPAEALLLVQGEMDQLDPDDVMTIRVDISRAVSTALGAWGRIRAFRPLIAEELPGFALAPLDNLEVYALAALHAHLSTMGELGENAVKSLIEEAVPLRENLLVAAEALAHRGLLDATRLAEIRSGHGHLDTAQDLVALGALFDSAWPAIGQRTAIERAEVDRATVLGTELLVALGQREQLGATVNGKGARARAFTLFVRAYDACQRAIAYLRWNEGDADQIAPSLFKVRRRAGKSGGVIEEPGAPDPVQAGSNGAGAPANGEGTTPLPPAAVVVG